MKERKSRLSYNKIVVLGFLAVIIAGGLLLMLPCASADRVGTDPLTAFFTSTSATCVTGLVVADTGTHWSFFGKLIILLMIQVGGLGFMTVITAASVLIHKRIGLHERTLLMQATGAMTHSSVKKLILRIVTGTFIFECAGAAVLAVRFVPQLGPARGIWYAVFHSISAFCNAGFDIIGNFSSFTDYSRDPLVCLTLCALIVIGGIGFIIWGDIAEHRFHFRKYDLHSKLSLSVSAALILIGWILFFLSEKTASMSSMSVGERILASLFHSVSTRTAGMNTADLSRLSDSGSLLSCLLMFIGGSSGSTAGGIKTTTFAVIMLSAYASATKRSSITVFKRSLDDAVVKRAGAIVTVYVSAAAAAAFVICALEPFGLKQILFEVVSAVGTVGLSMGVTTQLHTASRAVIMLLMFAGRIGGLSLALLLGENRKSAKTERPTENILVG
ncbi:MAG: Trk family potassium uptake protein [Oscillospiraceae bacterium]|nr:Trk family potassium uptake protein [Oscillospiraceae bacterium]